MEPGKKKVYIVLIILVIAMIAGVIIWSLKDTEKSGPIPTPVPMTETPAPSRTPLVFSTETEISVETIQDGLRDMGFLITQEYYFTEVVTGSKAVSIGFNETQIELGFTESSFTCSYDGVITAGIDFTQVKIDKDKSAKKLTVNIPHAEIKNVDIDPDSFCLYSEKTGLFTSISAEDYNASMVELEETARSKALDKGVLEKADVNAEAIIRNFIGCFEEASEYKVDVKFF